MFATGATGGRPPAPPRPVAPNPADDPEPWTVRDEAVGLRFAALAGYALLCGVIAFETRDTRLTIVAIVLVPLIVALWAAADTVLARAARRASRP